MPLDISDTQVVVKMEETWHSDLLNPLSKSFKALANKVATQVNLKMVSFKKTNFSQIF